LRLSERAARPFSIGFGEKSWLPKEGLGVNEGRDELPRPAGRMENPGLDPDPESGRLSRARASLIVMLRPLNGWLFNRRLASSAWAGSLNSTKANPLRFPVSRSTGIITFESVPTVEKNSLKSASVVS
jgi:hypothetical protein